MKCDQELDRIMKYLQTGDGRLPEVWHDRCCECYQAIGALRHERKLLLEKVQQLEQQLERAELLAITKHIGKESP